MIVTHKNEVDFIGKARDDWEAPPYLIKRLENLNELWEKLDGI